MTPGLDTLRLHLTRRHFFRDCTVGRGGPRSAPTASWPADWSSAACATFQLIHTDWDHHGAELNLDTSLTQICREVDQPSSALIKDLKRRGLLDDTLVIWGGEFGRTPMGEPRGNIGRDHHIDAYSMWLAGGGIKRGHVHGQSDEIGYNVAEGQVHVHDLQATVLHLLGLDHTRLTFRFQGRDFRLTDVAGRVVSEILA